MYEDAFTVFPVIETERLLLRQLEMSDVDDLFEYAKDRDAFIYTDGFPHDFVQVQSFVDVWRNEAYHSKQFIRWGIELKSEKKLVGGIYLFAPEGNDCAGRRMDMGYDVSRKYWNQGIASEAIGAVGRFGLHDMGLLRIQAQILPENIGSVRACEKAGFVNEGTLKNFLHYQNNGDVLKTVVMMALIPEDVKAEK